MSSTSSPSRSPSVQLSTPSKSHDQLIIDQLEGAQGDGLKGNLKILMKKILKSTSKRHSLLQNTEIVEKIMGIVKSKKGVDHIALQLLIEIGVDDVGADCLLAKGVSHVVFPLCHEK